MARDSHLQRILGPEKYSKIKTSKVLLVGAGGIGCELLKNLVMMNYGEIHIVDLDTIDLSNLNRQFLFRQKDIKKSKSMTALKAVQFFNNDTTLLTSYDGSIMDAKTFPLSWFEQFDIIFNALDNIEARTYVNRVALFLKKPLMESGTTGFKGQVQPIYPYQSECFECVPKETPKTFPVCTIRSTPSKPIHSITWAKNFLFSQLFGEEVEELQADDLNTDDKNEIDALLKESNELLDLKKLITSAENIDNDKTFIYEILDKIFNIDIERLLKIDSLWKTRAKPTPLNYRDYDVESLTFENDDQKLWSLDENLAVIIDSTARLTKRYQATRNISFDKDDEDTLDFVVAASNLRSYVFEIAQKTKFDVKQIAGNIIPAIATTNAIIAGFSAMQSLNCFEPEPFQKSHMIFTSDYSNKFISAFKDAEKRESCKSCSVPRGVLKLNPTVDLQTVVNGIRDHFKYEEFSILLGKNRLIYDFDFEDNLSKVVSQLGFVDGEVMLIDDADDELETSEFYIEISTTAESIELPQLEIAAKKQPADNDDEDEDDEDEDEVITIEDDDVVALESPTKRKIDDKEEEIRETPIKKMRLKDDSTIVVEEID